ITVVVIPDLFDVAYSTCLFLITEILIVRRVSYKDRMRRRRSFSWIDARIEPGVPTVPASVVIGLIPDDYAVLSANSKSAAVVVMGDVVTNYRIRCPYLKSIDRPPFPGLRVIITGTPFATDVACYGWRMRARQTLYKDAAAVSRPAYSVSG